MTDEIVNNISEENRMQAKKTCFVVDYQDAPPSTVKTCVIHGYPAPNMPRLFYLRTLWTRDNETLNVWSHLLTAFYFLWLLHKYSLELSLLSDWPVLVIIAASLIVTLCSAAAHLFHSRSEVDHCCWMLVDFFGIIMFSFGSTVVHFFACSELSYYLRFGYWNLAMLTFNCCFAYMILCLTKLPMKTSSTAGALIRVAVLGYGYIYGIVPILHRVLFTTGYSNDAVRYHVLSIILMSICPLMYITNMPQSFSPGTFDFIGHNHQIFHVFVSFTLYFDIYGVHFDVVSANGHWKALKTQPDIPSLLDIAYFALFIFVWCFALAYYTVYNVHKYHAKKA